MKFISLAAVAALAMGAAVSVHAENSPSFDGQAPTFFSETRAEASTAASLNALLAEWNHAAFNPPGKPGQSRVFGRDGYVTTGGGYNVMVSLIRSAANDVREGRDADAAPKIARARSLIAAANARSL